MKFWKLCLPPNKQPIRSQMIKAYLFHLLFALSIFVPGLGIIYALSLLEQQKLNATSAWILTASLAGILILRLFILWQANKNGYLSGARVGHETRLKLLAFLKTLPLGFFSREGAGHISNVMVEDISTIEHVPIYLAPQTFSNVIAISSLFILFLFLDWRLALIVLSCFVISLIVLLRAANRLQLIEQKKSLIFSEASGRIAEFIQGLPVMRSLNRIKEVETSQVGEAVAEICRLYQKVTRKALPMMVLTMSLAELSYAVTVLVGGWLFLSGDITAQKFIAILILLLFIHQPYLLILNHLKMWRLARGAHQRIEKMYATKPLQRLPESVNSSVHAGDVTFSSVDFSYDGPQLNLEKLSFVAPKGQVTAIVGPSGGGKSSILKLLARFWQPQAGKISIGRQDINTIPEAELTGLISHVLQDVILLNDTIENNIRLGNPKASFAEVENAARLARALPFIEQSPQGFQTQIGEGGAKLSGGERQRLSIARAILKDAPILLLDEPMAGVDTESEVEILKALDELVKNKTTLIVSHNLKFTRQIKNIVFVNRGKVIAQGSHETLLSTLKDYQELWQAGEQQMQWSLRGQDHVREMF